MNYKEEIKERLETVPDELRDFVLDENWREDAKNIAEPFNFDEEKYAVFENEVFLVLLGFELRTDFAENLKNELGIDANVAGWVAEDAEKEIFSKVARELDEMEQQTKENDKLELAQTTSGGVGKDFEQIILNQARAMRPAIPPENLPTNPESQPKVIHNYIGENDPYREPIE